MHEKSEAGGGYTRSTDAQAVVELAIVAPIMLVMALVVLNLMIFVGACARFDRLAPDIVIAQGVSPGADEEGTAVTDASTLIEDELRACMEGYGVDVCVKAVEGAPGGNSGGLFDLSAMLKSYSCTMVYKPWPRVLSIAGVNSGSPLEISHERTVTVDPWKPGVVM